MKDHRAASPDAMPLSSTGMAFAFVAYQLLKAAPCKR
jgi:hypothetical protein